VRNASSKAAPAAPVSEIHAFAPGADGTRIRAFTRDGVRVQVSPAIDADQDAAAAELIARLHAVCSIPPAPPRIEDWGPGRHDRTRLGPGVEAWIRVTPEGRVRLVIPGGDSANCLRWALEWRQSRIVERADGGVQIGLQWGVV
jgi:hypothetical protein